MADYVTMLTTKTRIHDLLESTGLFEQEQLEAILTRSRNESRPVCVTALEESDLKEEKFLEKLAETMALPFQRLKDGRD